MKDMNKKQQLENNEVSEVTSHNLLSLQMWWTLLNDISIYEQFYFFILLLF
jgi:hypothetical protein